MGNKIILLLCIVAGWLLGGCQQEALEQEGVTEPVDIQTDGFVQGKIRIKFKPGTDVEAIEACVARNAGPATRTGIAAMDAMAGRYGVKSVRRLFRHSPKFEKRHRKHGLHLWYEVEIDTTINTRSAGIDYQALPEVEYAGPVGKIRIMGDDKGISIEEAGLTVAGGTGRKMPFNDPLLAIQWHYGRGKWQTPLEEANIGLFKGWEVNTGNRDIIVAVFDGGIDVVHEDLAANMWVNEAEKNGVKGKDDDGNKFTDDIYGYNFSDKMGTVTADRHGTHVAGTVAAVNNNGKGVCGVAGGNGSGNGVRLMSCQILSGSNSQSTPEAYVYAADMGAVISQNSWGYTQPGFTEPAIKDAIDYFIEEAGNPEDHPDSPMRGGIVIFAAGNEGAGEVKYYPAAYDECVAVTATDYRNERASLSEQDHNREKYYANIGTWVDISAPGGMNGDPIGVLSTLPDNKYGFMCGTSMACPHVSGVAALIVSQKKGPDFTNEKLKKILLTAVLDLSEYEPNARYMGSGLVRADKALNPDDGIGPLAVKDLAVSASASAGCTLSWKVTRDEGDGKPELYRLYYSNAELTKENYTSAKSLDLILDKQEVGDVCSLKVEGLSEGVWYFAVAGFDQWENSSELSNVVTHSLLPSTGGRVFPTVVKTEATVYLGDAFKGDIKVTVYDAAGNKIKEQHFKDQSVLKVGVSGLTRGVYTLKVKSAGAEGAFRMVKK